MPDNHQRVAWVTGSSRGIGRAIATQLAQDGYDIVLHGRAPHNLQTSGEGHDLFQVAQDLAQTTGRQVIAVCGDLTDEAQVHDCYQRLIDHFGHLDILVCNAGGGNLTAELDRHTIPDSATNFQTDDFIKRLHHNILPTVLCCRECIRALRQSPSPRIVTIGSIAACDGHKTGGHSHTPYAMAKAAVHHYTRCLAAELRPENIPVNCVIPGNINTPTTRLRFGGDRANPIPGLSRLQHTGKPEDIARLVSFLCGEGGAYITGQCLRVDGGEQLAPV